MNDNCRENKNEKIIKIIQLLPMIPLYPDSNIFSSYTQLLSLSTDLMNIRLRLLPQS